jgi:hypothetical protein
MKSKYLAKIFDYNRNFANSGQFTPCKCICRKMQECRLFSMFLNLSECFSAYYRGNFAVTHRPYHTRMPDSF